MDENQNNDAVVETQEIAPETVEVPAETATEAASEALAEEVAQ